MRKTYVKVAPALSNIHTIKARAFTRDGKMASSSYKDPFEAVGHRNLTAVKHFIEIDGIKPNIKNIHDDTLAHVAVRTGDKAMLDYLLEKDPSLLHATGTQDTSLLDQAIAVNSMSMVKHLVDERKHRPDAIHFAAQACHLPAVEYFIEEKKVDPNARDFSGQPVIFAAARTPCQGVVAYLVDMKVDIFMTDYKGRNIFCQSALRCDLTLPKYLLDVKKLPVDTKNDYILQDMYLFVDKLESEQILNFTRYFVEEKHTPVNPVASGETPLHHASKAGMLYMVKYLVEHGADVKRKNIAGNTPAEVATKENVKQYLIEKEGQQRKRRSLSVHPMWVRKIQTVRRSSPLLDCTSTDGEPKLKSFTDVVSQQFCNFLILASAFLLRSSFERSDQQSSLRDIIESRIDPIAVDAVNNYLFRD